ncbi:MAG TPA: BsuPI-related putative proteinase inhibitor [Longimicrobium sp.]|nr:BsuPI-related putative proteinase inhibitor [Longimicrobium sp.]
MRPPPSLAVPVAALALAACPTAGNHLPAARLEVTASPDSIAPGDTLRLAATLSNPGRRPVRLEFDHEGCQVVFYVQREDHSIVHPPGSGAACVGPPAVIELAPGEARRFEDQWPATVGGEGTFTAFAVLWEHHIPRGANRELKSGHRSNQDTIRVAHPASSR